MYYFIINPVSGSGRGAAIWQIVQAELERLHVKYRSFLLSKGGEARILASSLSGTATPHTVVIVGGDGTINEFLNGLSSFDNLTFACIPTGSGNDFVRGLSMESDPLKALHSILHPGKIARINIGQLTTASGTASFAVSCGIGYDASVCSSVMTSNLKTLLNRFHLGKLVYLMTALRQLLTMKLSPLQITIDDETESRTYPDAYFAAAMNLCYEGGGFRFCPEALPDDDCIDLIIVNDISHLQALYLLPLAFSGKHVGHKGIHIIRCKKAVIESVYTRCVHTDGEVPGSFTHITLSLHTEKLAVILR